MLLVVLEIGVGDDSISRQRQSPMRFRQLTFGKIGEIGVILPASRIKRKELISQSMYRLSIYSFTININYKVYYLIPIIDHENLNQIKIILILENYLIHVF